ncbi:bifunctional riboflavin kinase/FAD synthetase [Planctomycetota bacterium]
MKVINKKDDFSQIRPGCVLTIGNFDGVHTGHTEILRTAHRIAHQRATQVVVMTFEPHPVAILFPERAPKVLTPLQQKTCLLAPYADDCVIVLEDNKALLGLSAGEFVEQFLMQTIRPSVIVEGHDFHFGAGRSGNVDTLRAFGRQYGFDVHIIEQHKITFSTGQSLRVSSTIIRYMLESGHVSDTTVALGRPYRLMGQVVPGRGKGQEIGFPTLNMAIPEQVIPTEGVYAGTVELASDATALMETQQRLPAVFSIGQARTFGDSIPLLVEAHLLETSAEKIRGSWMAMDFVQHLRSQHRYSNVQDLVAQIAKDCDQARRVLQEGQDGSSV